LSYTVGSIVGAVGFVGTVGTVDSVVFTVIRNAGDQVEITVVEVKSRVGSSPANILGVEGSISQESLSCREISYVNNLTSWGAGKILVFVWGS